MATSSSKSAQDVSTEQTLEWLERVLPKEPKSLRILDIGCGKVPHLALRLHQQGHTVYGVDPAVEHSGTRLIHSTS